MKAYWDSLTKEQQGELAGKVGSTPGYLRLVFNGYKKASFVLAKKLEQCTSGAITKSDLRPDTAIMGALALPVKSAITLESKMADVRKVVDGLDTPDAFKAMTEQVRALSTELAALGRPDATITRYDKSTFTCSSACTDAVNAPEWRYYWQINMPAATNTTWMTCGDPCDSALRIWGDTVVECVLNKLCPSHTYVIFKYPE